MRLWWRLVPPGLTIALGLVLAAELLARPGEPAPAVLSAVPLAGRAVAIGQATVDRWAATVLARPLFSTDRQPESLGKGQAAGLARLAGIIISGDSRAAIFAAAGQKPQIVSEGGEIGGYRLLHISYDAVELASATGTIILHPQFPLPAVPAPVHPPAPPPSAVDYDNL